MFGWLVGPLCGTLRRGGSVGMDVCACRTMGGHAENALMALQNEQKSMKKQRTKGTYGLE